MKWSGVIAMEGVPTVDNRVVMPDALSWDLPLPVVQWVDGTYDWAPIGRIDTIVREPHGVIRGSGTLDTEPVGDSTEMGCDEVEFTQEGPMIVMQSGRIRYVAIGERPAWDQCKGLVIEP